MGGTTMAVQKLSSKNQIVIPKEAREAMKVKGGDELLVVVKGDMTIIMPKPKDYTKALYGIAKGVYPPGYLKRERRSW
jgi:AbrB family looped-hinge helix DNA binding protein